MNTFPMMKTEVDQLRAELDAALARTARAEAEVERLQAVIDGADDDANWLSTVAAQRDELQQRVDELGEAARWWPVSEPPPGYGTYLVWRGKNVLGARIDVSIYYPESGTWGIDFGFPSTVTHWQPIPPPPAEETP